MPFSLCITQLYSTAHAEPKYESLITHESSALDSRGRGVEREHSETRTREGASFYSTRSSGSAIGGACAHCACYAIATRDSVAWCESSASGSKAALLTLMQFS